VVYVYEQLQLVVLDGRVVGHGSGSRDLYMASAVGKIDHIESHLGSCGADHWQYAPIEGMEGVALNALRHPLRLQLLYLDIIDHRPDDLVSRDTCDDAPGDGVQVQGEAAQRYDILIRRRLVPSSLRAAEASAHLEMQSKTLRRQGRGQLGRKVDDVARMEVDLPPRQLDAVIHVIGGPKHIQRILRGDDEVLGQSHLRCHVDLAAEGTHVLGDHRASIVEQRRSLLHDVPDDAVYARIIDRRIDVTIICQCHANVPIIDRSAPRPDLRMRGERYDQPLSLWITSYL